MNIGNKLVTTSEERRGKEKAIKLMTECDIKLHWDYNGLIYSPNEEIYSQKDWNQTLMDQINIAKRMFDESTSTNGNTLIVSPEAHAILEDHPDFLLSMYYKGTKTFDFVGMLGGYKVYRNSYSPYTNISVLDEFDLTSFYLSGKSIKCAMVIIDNLPTFNR
jgi:hypothetical protein